MYTNDSIYITGTARSGKTNHITKVYENLLIVLIVDIKTDKILDADCRLSLDITKKFFKHLLLNQLITDEKKISNLIETKYFGESAKAFIVAYKNALQNYKKIKN